MIRKSALLFALLLTVATGAQLQAQKIEGTYEFPQKVMTDPDAAPVDVVAKLVVTIKGDSALATWQLPIPGKETKPMALKGTIKGNTLTLQSATQQAKLRGPDGDERTIDVSQQYVLTVSGDEVSGEVSYQSSDENVQMPTRSLKGKRVTQGS